MTFYDLNFSKKTKPRFSSLPKKKNATSTTLIRFHCKEFVVNFTANIIIYLKQRFRLDENRAEYSTILRKMLPAMWIWLQFVSCLLFHISILICRDNGKRISSQCRESKCLGHISPKWIVGESYNCKRIALRLQRDCARRALRHHSNLSKE